MTTLRLSGLDLPDGRDPLGMWTLDTPAAQAFVGGQRAVPDQTLVWQVRLDRATAQTKVDLRNQFEQAIAASRRLNVIEAHLGQLDVGVPSYSYAGQWRDNPFSTYDTALMQNVEALRPTMRAYTLGETPSLRIDQALLQRCQDLYTQFRRILKYKTWIETDIDGLDIGLTTVDWGGDFTNVWKTHIDAEQRKVHLDAVRVALRSRHTTMQLIVVVSAGALGLALKAGIPGGQLLLLPSVYEYVRDVLQAWTDWRSSQHGQGNGPA